jgi:hypothetical protein
VGRPREAIDRHRPRLRRAWDGRRERRLATWIFGFVEPFWVVFVVGA